VPTPSTRQAEAPIPKPAKAPATAAEGLAGLLKFEPLKLDSRDDAKLPLVQKWLKERYNAALRAVRLCEHQYEAGTTRMSALCAATRQFVDAQLALVEKPSEKIRIAEWYVEFSNQAWRMADARLKAVGVTGFMPIDEAEARAARFDAEVKLRRLRAELNARQAERVAAAAGTPPAPILAALLQFERLQPGPGDDEPRKLLKERYNAALNAVKLYEYQYEVGTTRMNALCAATRSFVEARLALVDKPAEKIDVAEWYVAFSSQMWKVTSDQLRAGGAAGYSPIDEAEARAARFEAEIQLMRLRADLKEKQPERVTVAAEPGPAVQTSTPRQLPALLTAEPVEPAPGDDQRQKLLKERYNAALRSLKASYNRRKIDTAVPFMGVIAAARQLLAAEVALHKSEDIVRVHERYLELMKFLEKDAEAQFQHFIGRDELEAAHEARLDAEIKLLDAKSGRSQTQTMDAAALAKAEYEAAKATAQQRAAALTRAKANLLLLKTQYDRIVRLYEQKAIDPGLVTDLRNKRDAAVAAVDKAQATFRAAESEATLKRVQLDRLTNGSETKRAEPVPPANSTPASTH
jgi:hypothetical protein